jgi:hypothetical protein
LGQFVTWHCGQNAALASLTLNYTRGAKKKKADKVPETDMRKRQSPTKELAGAAMRIGGGRSAAVISKRSCLWLAVSGPVDDRCVD